MAQQTVLEIAPRQVTGKASKRLRKAGIIPANIFGHKEPSQTVQVEALALERVLRSPDARHLIALHLPDDQTQTVLLRHIQREPRTGKIVHVDFFRVSLTERIEAKIALRFVGESLGVKNEGGVLLHLLEAITVECQASDLVEAIEVDISPLAHIDDALHASDVKLPANYKLVTDPAEPIAKIGATRAIASEAEEAAAEAAPAAPAAPASSEG
jgi:large subunit ribosomal protein L25